MLGGEGFELIVREVEVLEIGMEGGDGLFVTIFIVRNENNRDAAQALDHPAGAAVAVGG